MHDPAIPFTRFLDPDGRPCAALPPCADDAELLERLYRQMVLPRLFDQKAVALQRTGRLGTFAQGLGQEASGVARGAALRPDHVLVPYYRDTGVQLIRGARIE